MAAIGASDGDQHDGEIHFPHLRLAGYRARNVNALHRDQLTIGQRIADGVANTMGSWRFIIVQSTILIAWIVLNIIGFIKHWDPYPFILLNLALSFQAAYAAPIIMMSQNRQAAKDRLQAEEDFNVNCRAEDEIATIHRRLEHLTVERWDALVAAQEEQLALLREIRAALDAQPAK
ncbi:MAG TPA: DUF1003 domain-containing protein [Thermomicrobiales bacterium]|nr:DUF1003 domain-containing protein [Thermomicrobiales bacterium]